MGKLAYFSAIVLLSALAPASAMAELATGGGGVALVPPAANTGAVAPSAQASTARDTKKAAGRTLRCWQNGRLLYESAGFRPETERQANAVTVQRLDGESVVVFDQKDAICILSGK